jgi:hypothetical protein
MVPRFKSGPGDQMKIILANQAVRRAREGRQRSPMQMTINVNVNGGF